MRQTRDKNIIGRFLVFLLLGLLGQVVLSSGIYWPYFLAILEKDRFGYWLAFWVGIVLSVATASPIGLFSLVLIMGGWGYERVREKMSGSLWLLIGFCLGLDFLVSVVGHLGYGVKEVVLVLITAIFLTKIGFYKDEIKVGS